MSMHSRENIPHHLFAYLTIAEATKVLAKATEWCAEQRLELDVTFTTMSLEVTSPNYSLNIHHYPLIEMTHNAKGTTLFVYRQEIANLAESVLGKKSFYETMQTQRRSEY